MTWNVSNSTLLGGGSKNSLLSLGGVGPFTRPLVLASKNLSTRPISNTDNRQRGQTDSCNRPRRWDDGTRKNGLQQSHHGHRGETGSLPNAHRRKSPQKHTTKDKCANFNDTKQAKLYIVRRVAAARTVINELGIHTGHPVAGN